MVLIFLVGDVGGGITTMPPYIDIAGVDIGSPRNATLL